MSLSTPPAEVKPTSPPFAWIEWLAIPALYSLMLGGVYALGYALLLAVAGAGDILPIGGFLLALTLLVLVWLAMLLDDWATSIAPESLLVAAPRVVNGALITLLVAGAYMLTLFTGFSFFPYAGASSDLTTLLAFLNAMLIGVLYYSARGYPHVRREQAFNGGYGVHAWLLRSFAAALAVSVLLLFLGVLQPRPGAFFIVALASLPISLLSGALALALARLLTVARAPVPPSEPPAEGLRSWYPFLRNFGIVAVLAVIIVELLAVTGLLNLLITLLNPLWTGLEQLVGGALAGIAQFLAPLLRLFNLPQQRQPPQQTQAGTGKQATPPPAQTSRAGAPTAPHTNVIVISPLALTLIALGIVVFLALCFVIPWLLRRRRIRRHQPVSRMPWFLPGIVATVGTLLLVLLLLAPPLLNPNPQVVATRVVLPISLPVVGSQLLYGGPASGSGNGQGSEQSGGKGGSGPQSSGGSQLPSGSTKPSNANATLQIPHWLIQAVTIGLAVILLAALAAIGAAIWRSKRKRKQDEDEGVYKIAREQQPQPAPVDPFQGDAARVYYRQLLRAAARAGEVWTRRPTETPVEYEARLRALLATNQMQDRAERGGEQTPEAMAALADLTTAYRVARYKGDATDKQRSERLRRRLPRLLGALGGRIGA